MMRRAEKEITDRALIDAVLHKAEVLRLALVDQGEPYIVPLMFGYDGRRLVFHSAREGRKIDILRINPRVCFECEVDVALQPADSVCSWSVEYRSVIGYGTARFLEDPEEKRQALELLMDHYTSGPYEFRESSLAASCLVEILVESVSGKMQ